MCHLLFQPEIKLNFYMDRVAISKIFFISVEKLFPPL